MKYASSRVIILVFLAALHLIGCVSADPAIMKAKVLQILQRDRRAPNWFSIHKNPKVGDFAEYQGLDGSLTRTEILSQKGNLYEVANIVLKVVNHTPKTAKIMEDIVLSCFVTITGYCQEAYIFDKETGKKFSIQVAKPGDDFYVEYPQPIDTEKVFGETIITPVGEKKISQVMVRTTKVYAAGVSMNMTATYLIHPDVKFQVVRIRFINAMKLQPVTVVHTLQNYIPGDPVQKRIIDFVLGKLEKQEYQNGSDLIRQN